MTTEQSHHLLNSLYYEGPGEFTTERVRAEPELFAMRGALFYTPTLNIPDSYVGTGSLNLWLPLAIPTVQEFEDNRSRQSVRLWDDLLQRASGKIRWVAMRPAKVRMIRHDSYIYSQNDIYPKSLLDALKTASTGRRDRRLLHYFGAIWDDNGRDLLSLDLSQVAVAHPSNAGTRVIVEQA